MNRPFSIPFMLVATILGFTTACDDGSKSSPKCGNAQIESGEECDGDQLGSQSCSTLGYSGGFLMCGQDCQLDVSACEFVCGNGRVEAPFEVCDDGNTEDGDGCDLACGIENGWSCNAETGCTSICGDSLLVGDEECDGDQWVVADCAGLAPAFYGGPLACVSETCLFETSGCNQCGDVICMANDGEDRDSCPDDCARVATVSCGGLHTCAVLGDGSAWCWGNNLWGQLGVGNLFPSAVPLETFPETDPQRVQIAGAERTCAISGIGGVLCWGAGAIGDGTSQGSSSPVQPTGLSQDFVGLAIGSVHMCAVLSDGKVWCWGGNSYGQMGIDGLASSLVPVEVPTLAGVEKIVAGDHHTCALMSNQAVFCWGRNTWGQVGDGTTENRSLPTRVTLNAPAMDIATGTNHTCAVLEDETIACWGSNSHGQLGNGSTIDSPLPSTANLLGSVPLWVSGGLDYTCAIDSSSGVICWGANAAGQLGDGTTTDRVLPVGVATLNTQVTAVSTGGSHACATKTDGSLWCWGNNEYGQFGNGTAVSSLVPVAVSLEL